MFHRYDCEGKIVVIIDVFRASSAICTAFHNGVAELIPVAEVEEAREYKRKGFLVAAERDGFVLDFADFGNSPFNFIPEKVEGKRIVYSTTNGTQIIQLTKDSFRTVIGSFLNISALTKWILGEKKDVILFCAGWKGNFSLEDTICAGAFASRLLGSKLYNTICDSTIASVDLWKTAEKNLSKYIDKAAHRNRLREKGLDDCIEFCITHDFTNIIPVVEDGILKILKHS